MLRTLHSVQHILNEEECRSVGKAGDCWRELVVVIAVKTPGAVKETLGVLEKYKGRIWHDGTAKEIKSKLCSCVSLCRRLLHTVNHTLHSLTVDCMRSK